MKRFVIAFLLIISASVVGIINEAGGDTKIKTIKVSTSREFLEALGSDRIIEMKPGKYNLSEWDPVLNNQPEQEARYSNLEKKGNPKLAKGVTWSDNPFDGGELVLSGIKNLTIIGVDAEIIIDPRYAFVMNFKKCGNIVIEKLTAGHSEGGYCAGGVFAFSDSSKITINSTNMYGCGTYGLELTNVSDMKVSSSNIYECTYGIMVVSGGKNIAFDKCVFRDNREFTLISVSGTKNVSFTNCEFKNNKGEMFSVRDTTVTVSNSAFKENNSERPVMYSNKVKFNNCEFD